MSDIVFNLLAEKKQLQAELAAMRERAEKAEAACAAMGPYVSIVRYDAEQDDYVCTHCHRAALRADEIPHNADCVLGTAAGVSLLAELADLRKQVRGATKLLLECGALGTFEMQQGTITKLPDSHIADALRAAGEEP